MQIKELSSNQSKTVHDAMPSLLVYNDDVNTFDHVIDTLQKICAHTQEQATQAAVLVHNTGKCAVKSGSYTTLQPMCIGLIDAGISAKITY
jgi:ATP-dependent Clp protease adaptor protein ClpS